jgi:ParB-like chromosome segregation protein Spo0J
MLIHCSHQRLVPIAELVLHPQNNNHHPAEQITRLAKIMAYQGWRYPVKVSTRSGYVVSGHGRIAAARVNGWTEIPCDFQPYDSAEQELADLTADNAIASWAEFNAAQLEESLRHLDPSFDQELFGVKSLVPLTFDEPEPKPEPSDKEAELKTCPNCGVLIE